MSPGPGHLESENQPPLEEKATDLSNIEPLPTGMIDHLRIPDVGDERPQVLQTHISHLFLTHDRVYKIRKAVRFDFLSFATRVERNRDCLLEVALNRRLSPDVYLGLAPILESGHGWEIGEVNETLTSGSSGGASPEHCVVMRRLPERGDAQDRLEDGHLSHAHVDALADRVASFHQANRLPPSRPAALDAWNRSVVDPFFQSLQLIENEAPDPGLVESAVRLASRARDALAKKRDLIIARRLAGLAVDGHGDLQLAHMWFEGECLTPLIIDCTEFNQEFRHLDPASEVAFVAMDFRYRGRPELAERFLARYARETGDFGLYALVDCLASYRATVRAKVALLAALDPDIPESQHAAAMRSTHDHVDLAERHLQEPGRGSMVLICGIVGTGKSSVARVLGEALSGVVIASDRIRKQRAGMALDDHRGASENPGEGLYREDRVQEVYAAVLEQAAPVVDSGRCAILDASFPRASQRRAVLEWARERGIRPILVQVTCAADETLDRLARRESQGDDASDAGPSLYPWSAERFEAPTEWPDAQRLRVATDRVGWQDRLTRDLPAILASQRAGRQVHNKPK